MNTLRIFSKIKITKAFWKMINIILNNFDAMMVRRLYLTDTFCFIREDTIFTVSSQQCVSYAEGKFLD